jgi:small multidrug resistance family-3 protein
MDGKMDVLTIARSLALFVVAGLLEIGGGYLVWLWLRDGRGVVLGAIGGLILFLYGVVPTLQPSTFGRTYAAYGGFFVVLSLLWGLVDRRPGTGSVGRSGRRSPSSACWSSSDAPRPTG